MVIFILFPFRRTLPKKESQSGHSNNIFGRVRRKGKRKDAHILIRTFPFIATFVFLLHIKVLFYLSTARFVKNLACESRRLFSRWGSGHQDEKENERLRLN